MSVKTERVAYYKTETGEILCDPCSVVVCRTNHAVSMNRVYESHVPTTPYLTCEMCGERHAVKQ